MNKKAISTFITYNFWANQRILQACSPLATSEFVRAVTPDPGWGTLRGILVHALDAEFGWRSVLQAQENDVLESAAFPDVATLQARWSAEEAHWVAYLTELPEEALHHHTNDDPRKPKVWQTIMHVVNHSTQHRAEAAAILTGYGQSPGELDLDLFLNENPQYV